MKQHKKILFVCSSLSKGGAGKMVNHVAGLLSKEYEEILAVNVGEEEYFSLDNGVTYLEPLHEHKGGLKGFYHTIKAINKTIKAVRPDIVVAFVSDVAVCTRIASLTFPNIVVVSAERGDPYTLNGLWRKLVSWAYRKSDYCFFQLSQARDFFGPKVVKKSFVIPNAAIFNENPGQHKALNKTIVGAGRFVKEKGFEMLIEAFYKVHNYFPDYCLVLYGDGNCLPEYTQQVKALGLENSVRYPGYSTNIGRDLKDEGIFVLSSRYEGIPNVLIEAMLTGIPTVSFDCTPGGPRFLTKDGERGLLVPLGDVDALAKSIINLIKDKELYRSLEIRGPELYKELAPDKIESLWIEAFKAIAGESLSRNN